MNRLNAETMIFHLCSYFEFVLYESLVRHLCCIYVMLVRASKRDYFIYKKLLKLFNLHDEYRKMLYSL